MKPLTTLIAATLAMAGAAAAQMPTQMPGQPQGPAGFGQVSPGSQVQPPSPMGQRGFTPPGAANLQALSGQWYYSHAGGTDRKPLQVQVDPSGRFQARGGSMVIQGEFQGMVGQAMVTSPDARGRGTLTAGLQLQFDGQCHISTMLYAQNGQPIGPGQMHVNHQPGAPCPT